MMTVLIKHQATGREVLFEAERVEFHDGNRGTKEGAGLLLNFVDGSATHFALSTTPEDSRDVFVMNSAGKTVARYML